MAYAPKVKKVLTLPMLKLVKDMPVYVKITEKFFIGKAIDDKKEPATIANVVCLDTKEGAQIIVPSVLKSTLTEAYPDDGYVGKCFMITKTSAAGDAGKAYAKFSISELEDDTEEKPAKGK
jgi:hypothetical protein